MEVLSYELVESRKILLSRESDPVILYELTRGSGASLGYFSGIANNVTVKCDFEISCYVISEDGDIGKMDIVPDYFISSKDMKKIFSYLRLEDRAYEEVRDRKSEILKRIFHITNQVKVHTLLLSCYDDGNKLNKEGVGYYGKRFYYGKDEREFYIKAR